MIETTSIGTKRGRVCEWCHGPQIGENRCICDRPRYTEMETCSECGKWTDVDHLMYEDWDSDPQCHDCFTTFDL